MYASVVSLAAEFPNDNPSMHRGAIWVCDSLTGSARAELPPPPSPPLPIAPALIAAVIDVPALEAAASSEDASLEVASFDLASGALEVASPAQPEIAAPARTAPEAISELASAPASAPTVVTLAEPATLTTAEVSEDAAPAAVTDDESTLRALHLEELHEAVPPPAPKADDDEGEAGEVIVEELDPVDARTEGIEPVFDVVEEIPATTSSEPPPSGDPFVTLVCTLADVAIGAGAAHVASLLPGLFFDGRVEGPIDGELEQLLRAAGVSDGAGIDPAFVATTDAWRAILRGTSDDFSACTSMLDEWAAELLARLIAAPAPALRQELRSRGVAAFGLAV